MLGINWRRGALRFWIVVSALWCAAVMAMSSGTLIAALHPISVVHVKVSDTETWDYPVEMGVAEIRSDVDRRLAEQAQQARERLARMPERRKAECHSLSPNTPLSKQPADCVELSIFELVGTTETVAFPGWEAQLYNRPLWQALVVVGLILAVPPAIVFLIGGGILWALAGFISPVGSRHPK